MRRAIPLAMGLSALAMTACGSATPDADVAMGSCPPGQYCVSPYTPTGSGTATGSGTGTGVGAAPVAAQPATPIEMSMVTPLITALASNEVQGMQAEGGAFGGSFLAGQVIERPFTLQPGRCYSVVAVGLPGLEELDAEIVAQPGASLPDTVVAVDQRSGSQAIVGGGGQCFTHLAPAAVPAKIVIRATRGAGLAGAQLYVK